MRILKAVLLASILALAGAAVPSSGQESHPKKNGARCGSIIPQEQIKAELALKKNIAPQLAAPPIDAPYYLPLTIHIVHRSNGTGGLTLDQLDIAMRDLNRMWRQVGIQFFIYGEIDHINDDTYYVVPNDQASRDVLRQINVVPNTINVYFSNFDGICGQASITRNPVQGVLVDKDCTGVLHDPSTFAHEIGHYFNLFHTHETEAFGPECPNGENCKTAGDLLCDTPADPNQGSTPWWKNCGEFAVITPPQSCGATPYNPPTSNLMSYARATCVSDFTPEQISKALQTLHDASNRRNLMNSKTRYVHPQAFGSANCEYDTPCKSLASAVEFANDGDFIFLKPGVYRALSIGGKRVTLRSWGHTGVVEIVP